MQLHKRIQTSNGKAVLTRSFTPSRGPVGTFVRVVNAIYLRGSHKGFYKMPEWMSRSTIAGLEKRAVRMGRVRVALAIVLGLVIGFLVTLVRR